MKKLYMNEAFPGRVNRPHYQPEPDVPEPEVEVDEYPYTISIRKLDVHEPPMRLGYKNEQSARYGFEHIVAGIDERGDAKTVTLMNGDRVLEVY